MSLSPHSSRQSQSAKSTVVATAATAANLTQHRKSSSCVRYFPSAKPHRRLAHMRSSTYGRGPSSHLHTNLAIHRPAAAADEMTMTMTMMMKNINNTNNNNAATCGSKDHVVAGGGGSTDNNGSNDDSDGGSVGGGYFMLSALMPFLHSVKQFLVGLVYTAVATQRAVLAIGSSSSCSERDERAATTAITSLDADDKTPPTTLAADFIDSNCIVIDSLAVLASPPASNCGSNTALELRHAELEQPHSFLHTSLLDLITMEAPDCFVAPRNTPIQQQHVGIDTAVNLYLSTLTAAAAASSPPAATVLLPAIAVPAVDARLEARQARKKQQHKRKHHMPRSPLAGDTRTKSHGNITWPNGGVAAAAFHHPPTTMHSLATALNVKPLHKCSHKNRREKERHVLTRHIHDVLLNTNEIDDVDDDHEDPADRRHNHSDEDDECDIGGITSGLDMVDFCLVRSSVALSPAMGFCISVPETTSFTCFTHDDFPEMCRAKSPAAAATKSIGVVTTPATKLVEDASPSVPTQTPATTTAAAPKLPASLSWEISVDELRTPSRRPSGQAIFERGTTTIVTVTVTAATVAVAGNSSQQAAAATTTITSQYQQLLLSGLKPHGSRVRQISECSDDFISFERGEDDDDDDSICYDVADDSTDEESDDDDDNDDDDSSEDDSDDDDTDDESDDDETADAKKRIVNNRKSAAAVAENDDDGSEESDESESESETCSATQQLDSGFEEKKGNKVRFAIAPCVHVIRAWSFAYRQARKSYWEQVGRDRVRFAERCRRIEETLAPVLSAKHRQRVLIDRRRIEAAHAARVAVDAM